MWHIKVSAYYEGPFKKKQKYAPYLWMSRRFIWERKLRTVLSSSSSSLCSSHRWNLSKAVKAPSSHHVWKQIKQINKYSTAVSKTDARVEREVIGKGYRGRRVWGWREIVKKGQERRWWMYVGVELQYFQKLAICLKHYFWKLRSLGLISHIIKFNAMDVNCIIYMWFCIREQMSWYGTVYIYTV